MSSKLVLMVWMLFLPESIELFLVFRLHRPISKLFVATINAFLSFLVLCASKCQGKCVYVVQKVHTCLVDASCNFVPSLLRRQLHASRWAGRILLHFARVVA